MYIPLCFLVAAVLLLGGNLAIDLWRLSSRRHHDHLIEDTPRSLRG